MAAVMLAGAPLCNEAYAALATNANSISVEASSAKFQNGTKFIIEVTSGNYYVVDNVANTETGKTYATFTTTSSTTADVAKAAIFEATNVNITPLGISFELTVNGKPFALKKNSTAVSPILKTDKAKDVLTTFTSDALTEYTLSAMNLKLVTSTGSANAVVGNGKLKSKSLTYNSVNLNEFNANSTTFSFPGENLEGNVFNGVVPFTFDANDLVLGSAAGTYFVKGAAADVKALKEAGDANARQAALKKLSVVAVVNDVYGINTSVAGEGYKLALISGADFYKTEKPAKFGNSAFTTIKEADQLNNECEVELNITLDMLKADGTALTPAVKIQSVKASASDTKTYVTTVAASTSTPTRFAQSSNPTLGANTFFAATNFLKAGEVSAFNVFFTSGKAQPAGVQPQEYGRYLSVVSATTTTPAGATTTSYHLHATSPDSTLVNAPLSQWIVSNFDGKNTVTLTNREARTTLNLKLEATKNAGEYNVVGGSDANTTIDNIVAGTTTPTNVFKTKTIKLIPTTLTKNDGYLVLSKEDMSSTIGVSFSGKDAIKGNQTYYMQFEKPATGAITTKFVPTLKASDAVEVNFKLNEVDNTKDLVTNNYAYLDKEGRILTDAIDTLAIPSYTVSYTYDKKAYYVTGGDLKLTTAASATAAGASRVVLKKHFNGTYGFGAKGQASSAAGADSKATAVTTGAFANSAKINALNDADFAYASLSLQYKNDYETLKAVSRHATFEAVNVAGGVTMQENKNGILEGIIGADALTFWLDTADSEKATPSFYISKGIAKAEETKAYNDEVRNFLFNPTDSAKIYNAGSATAAVDKKYILEGTTSNLKAIFRPAALIAEDTMTTVVDGKELTVVTKDADADKAQVNGLKNFQYGICLNNKDVADEYVVYSKASGQYLYNLNGKLGFTNSKKEALVVTLGEGDATANEAIAAENVAVIAGEGVVTVKGAAGKQVVVSNILGQVIANKVATSDEETIAVAAGVAVVVVDGEATKVVVK